MKQNRPSIGETVEWVSPSAKIKYTAIVKIVRVRSRVAKIVRDYSSPTSMPFQYFWVDFDEIGYGDYPIAFRTKTNKILYKHKKDLSDDGTPRYVCNPKSPDNTYSLKDCMADWEPIYSVKNLKSLENENK